MPSESERLIVDAFHAMRKAAKAERRRQRGASEAIDRVVAYWMERENAAHKANWQAARDAYERTWD